MERTFFSGIRQPQMALSSTSLPCSRTRLNTEDAQWPLRIRREGPEIHIFDCRSLKRTSCSKVELNVLQSEGRQGSTIVGICNAHEKISYERNTFQSYKLLSQQMPGDSLCASCARDCGGPKHWYVPAVEAP